MPFALLVCSSDHGYLQSLRTRTVTHSHRHKQLKTYKRAGIMTKTHSQMHACLHKCTYRDTRAHAHSLMRDFLTFLHVPLENIDESPFKNNSSLVGSLNDLQLFHQHIIITFIMLDRTGLSHCGRRWTLYHNIEAIKSLLSMNTLYLCSTQKLTSQENILQLLKWCITTIKLNVACMVHCLISEQKKLLEEERTHGCIVALD